MITDTFIEIGSQHQMCEDYIISGPNYIILADGCSGSKHSEMGARFLCYMARMFMVQYGVGNYGDHTYPQRLGNWVIHNAEMLTRQLGLDKSSLDATLIVAYQKDDFLAVHMFGDGHIVLNTIYDPEYEIYSVDYKAGQRSMPYYLRYLIDKEGHELYHEKKVSKMIYKDQISFGEFLGESDPVERAYDEPESWYFNVQAYRSISICSDGLGTFLRSNPEESGNKIMNAYEMVPSIFNFKSNNGVFLQREINICKRQRKKAGLKFEHFDDLSIGTFLREDAFNAEAN